MKQVRTTGRQSLSPRDRTILLSLNQHHYLNARQVEQFFFYRHASSASGGRSCRRVLKRLYIQKLVVRVTNRQVGGWMAGSSSYVYSLSRLGQTLIADSHQPVRFIPPSYRSPLFLEHSLAIAKVHLALREAHRLGKLELIEVQTEPSNWRRFTGNFGNQEILKPDVYAITAPREHSRYEDMWFLEIDRATMSSAVILRKCQQYISYRQSLSNPAHDDAVFPMVIWLVPNNYRKHQIKSVIGRLPPVHQDIFRVMLQPDLVPFIKARYYLERLPIVNGSLK
jgi:hypothetical protein